MVSRFVLGVSGTIIAALTGSYIFFGPAKKRTKDQCRGLVNVGNSCFLNSLLQAWAACPSLYTWLQRSLQSHSSSSSSSLLASTIFHVLKVLNNEEEGASDPYDPSGILRALRARRWVITSDEQDAHELFHVLTETLEEETSRYPRVLSLFDVRPLQGPNASYQPENQACTRSRGLLPILPARSVDQPTRGLLASQLHCLACGWRCPVKYDVFDSLSLSLPRNYWGPISLDILLKQFISPEIVEDVDCEGCAKLSNQAKIKASFRKRVSIGKLPQVLCLHLHRTQWLDNGAQVKRADHISFPETLHMDQYLFSKTSHKGVAQKPGLCGGTDIMMNMLSQTVKPEAPRISAPVNLLRTLNYDLQFTQTGLFLGPQQAPQIPQGLSDINHNAPPEQLKAQGSEFNYRIGAVVCHLGDNLGGHFTTYRRGVHSGDGDMGSRWWLASDSSVKRVSLQQALSAEAYMLFYERM